MVGALIARRCARINGIVDGSRSPTVRRAVRWNADISSAKRKCAPTAAIATLIRGRRPLEGSVAIRRIISPHDNSAQE